MGNVFDTSHWLVFAGVALVVSWGLRGLAALGRREGGARVRTARTAVGLPAESPRERRPGGPAQSK